jgi:tetratricopeptide (TPR) repeat protein
MTGDIIRDASGIALAVRVTDSQTGRQLAARRVNGLTPVTLMQASDEIAVRAKEALGLPPTEKVDVFAADFLSRNPKSYQLYIAGLRALDAYHYAEAERSFAEALEKAPDYTMARYRLAHAQAAAGKTGDALVQIRKAAAEIPRLPERDAMYVGAAEAYFDRRYDEALTRYATLLKRYPYELEARRFRASIFLETRRYDQAIEEASVIVRLAPENHTVWAVLGAAYLAKKDFEHAAGVVRKYAELEPNSPNAHEMLADFYRSQSELDMAAEEYAKAFALDPGFRSSAIALAVVDALRGRRDEAARRLKALVSDSSAVLTNRLDAAFELSYILRAQGRFRESVRLLESLQNLLRTEGVREALALSVRGSSHMELGEYREAERLIRLAIQRSPQGGAPTRYVFAEGLLEIRRNRLDEARKTASLIAEKALPRTNPDRTEEKAAAYLRGLAFLAENKSADAVTALSPALSLAGYDYAIYRLAQARAYLESGDLPAAFAAARQATSPLDPVEPRLDLELDRVRGLLLLAEIQSQMEKPAEAAHLARQFLAIWTEADPNLPDVLKARRLAGPTQ